MNNIISTMIIWIKYDYRSNNFRFSVELAAWVISVGCAFTMAITVPDPPLQSLYPLWILGCSMYAWAAYTRRSFGMLANYMLLVSIDTIGLLRMIFN